MRSTRRLQLPSIADRLDWRWLLVLDVERAGWTMGRVVRVRLQAYLARCDIEG